MTAEDPYAGAKAYYSFAKAEFIKGLDKQIKELVTKRYRARSRKDTKAYYWFVGAIETLQNVKEQIDDWF